MQQFALASVYPRSIAWLVRVSEWERFEEIVKYNCAVLGGYYNIIIPLMEQDTISDEYKRFLTDYDPDLIVLAPKMTISQFNSLSLHVSPFGIILWDLVSGFVSSDPIGGGSGKNATMVSEWLKIHNDTQKPSRTYVAVTSERYSETSKLAFVACGDVEARTPMLDKVDETIELDATGYRENFLERLLETNVPQHKAGAYLENQDTFIAASNRQQLNELIKDEYKFPLSNAVEILRACFELQHFPSPHQSFISLTAKYQKVGGTPPRNFTGERPPAIVILISDCFNIDWILDYPPPKRRAVHYLDLRNILQKVTPSATEDYFKTASSKLPDEVFQLLEKGLLERGFSLSCSICSYRSWYPAERVGQTFECARCFQTQIYNSNPLWLYKLPEVIFQGFNHHMEVPLLALNYLKNTSKHTFEWVPDSDVYMQTGDNKSYRNLDILCIVDGPHICYHTYYLLHSLVLYN